MVEIGGCGSNNKSKDVTEELWRELAYGDKGVLIPAQDR